MALNKQKARTAQHTQGGAYPALDCAEWEGSSGGQGWGLQLRTLPRPLPNTTVWGRQLWIGHKPPTSSEIQGKQARLCVGLLAQKLSFLPDTGGFSGTSGLSLAKTSLTGARALASEAEARQTGRKGLVPKSFPAQASFLARRKQDQAKAGGELARACERPRPKGQGSPRLRGAGWCGYRPGALCPRWWRQWSWRG